MCPQVHLGLDLEAGAAQVEERQDVAPEGVEAVAQVAVADAVDHPDHHGEAEVAHAPDQGEVSRPAPVHVARTLDVVGAGHEGIDERDDLLGHGRAVRVDADDDVAGGRFEPLAKGRALAAADLHEDACVGPQLACDGDGVVLGMCVDDDDLGDEIREPRHDVRQVGRLVHGRDDDRDRGSPFGRETGRRILAQGAVGRSVKQRDPPFKERNVPGHRMKSGPWEISTTRYDGSTSKVAGQA